MVLKSRTPFAGIIVLTFALLLPLPPATAQQLRALGLDISAWQGNISQATWNNIRNVENRQFIILRSSRGGTTGYYNQNDASNSQGLNTLSQRYDDPYYIQNINRVTAAGMFAGSYHFSRPDIIASTLNSGGIPNSGTDEANHFMQMAGPWMRPGYLMPVHDLEAGDGIRTDNEMAQFCIDFSTRIYEVTGIRPAIYINGNYAANVLGTASLALRNQIVQLPANVPSPVAPAYPTLWSARWPNQADPNSIDVQNGEPKDSYAQIYGPWDDAGVTHPWSFWQYASTGRLQSFNNGNNNLDFDVARGGSEFLKDNLVPAVWMNDSDGQWTTLANWNSGQTPVTPVPGPGQAAPVGTLTLPTPRLPGGSGNAITSGTNDTVILERPNANITVTLASGTHNIRKLYMREALNLTGGSLTINYVPSWDSTTNAAQFSGPVTLSGSASLSLHTLQVDAARTFTLGGGTLTFNTIKLMPHASTPAKMTLAGDVNFAALANATALITKGAGAGNSGSVDLGGGNRSWNVANGTADVDLSVAVPISNGALSKTGAGTLSLSNANTYALGTTISAGRLLVNNPAGSGTGTGGVTVNSGGTLGGGGTIAGIVTVNSGGTISPGASIGTLTLNSAPVFNGTNFMEINRNGGTPLADKIVLTSGTLAYGGALVVSNTGAALVNGDTFTLFSAGAYSGSFAATNLPILGGGLAWYLDDLTQNGTIKVVAANPSTPPAITNHPSDLTVIAGQNALFTVTAGGTAPLSYQWRFNNTNIAGATQSGYTRLNAQTNDAGPYRVVITNSIGAITSSPATLAVNYSLAVNATVGGSAVPSPSQSSYTPGSLVSVTATPLANFAFTGWSGDASGTGNPLNVTLTTNKNITANFLSTSTDIILDNTNAEVTFSGDWQTGVTSTDRYLDDYRFASTLAGGTSNVTYRPAIGVPGYYDVFIWYPEGANRATNAPWSVVYDGGSVNVPVDQTINGGGWRLIAAARPFQSGTSGYARLSNDTGYSGKVVMADAVRFTFVGPFATPPGITTHPQSQSVNQGGNATFTVVATGSPLNYQWRFGAAPIAGATDSSYTRTNVQPLDVGNYSVVITNSAGSTNSTAATLTVNVPPAITCPSALAVQCFADVPVPNPDAVISSSACGPVTNSFVSDAAVTNGCVITITRTYRATDACGMASDCAQTITVQDTVAPVITCVANQTNECGSAIAFTAPDVSDNCAGSVSLVILNTVTNAGCGNTFVATRTWRATDACGNFSDCSQTIALRDTTPPDITCPGNLDVAGFAGIPAADTNSVTASDTCGSTTVSHVSDNLSTNAGTITLTRTYRATDACGNTADCNQTITAPLGIAPEISAHPQSQTAKRGTNVTFSVTADGTPAPAYQWWFNDAPLAGATDSSYTRSNVQTNDAGDYSVVVTNLAGTITSSNATLTVTLPLPFQFQTVERLADGRLRLIISGEPGESIWLDRASNLVDWLQLTNFVNTNGTFEFIDDDATNHESGFYRTRQ